MRRSTLYVLATLPAAAILAACAESPTGLEPAGLAPVTGVVTTPPGAASLTISAPDAVDCEGVADVTLVVSGRDEPRPLDIVIVMDASAGIGSANYSLMQQRISAMIDSIGVSAAGNHMAVVQFAGYATTWHPFASTQTNSAVKGTVNARGWTGGQSWMRSAVQQAINQWDAHGHSDARRILLLVTDGNPNPASTQEPCALASGLVSRNVHTYIFGIGDNWTSSVVTCLVADPSTQIHEPSALDQMSAALRTQIEQRPGIRNVRVSATVAAGFMIEGVPSVDGGSVSVSGSTITWTLSELGAASRTLNLAVRASSAAGATPLITDASISYVNGSTTTTQVVSDLGITVGSCDDTPPEIRADITGTLGREEWYRSDVTLAWRVWDAESPYSIDRGCVNGSVTSDTDGVMFECAATSAGGAARTARMIRRDATRPVISFHGANTRYLVTEMVRIDCAASDAMSGIAEAECPSVDAPAATFGVGTHTVSASARDVAGNSSQAAVSFTVMVTHGALCELVQQWVAEARLARELCGYLQQAERHGAHPGRASEAAIRNFIRTVTRLPSTQLRADRREMLILLANEL